MEIIKSDIYEKIQLKQNQYEFVSDEIKLKNAIEDKENITFYLCDNNKKVGLILLKKFDIDKFFLWNFLIDFNYQNKGIGKKFLIDVINIIINKYNGKIITTTYKFGNNIAKNLYESLGFIQQDIVKENNIYEVNMKLEIKNFSKFNY